MNLVSKSKKRGSYQINMKVVFLSSLKSKIQIILSGAENRTWTYNLRVTRALLYLLSYFSKQLYYTITLKKFKHKKRRNYSSSSKSDNSVQSILYFSLILLLSVSSKTYHPFSNINS